MSPSPEQEPRALLRVENLGVTGPNGPIVHGSSFVLDRGRTLALVGESGSGKSVTARALTGLLPAGLAATGRAELDAVGLPVGGEDRQWRSRRGRELVLLLQDPFTSLSPTHRCGRQIAAALPGPIRRDRAAARTEVTRLLAEVDLPARVDRAYPFELSGGMRQRVAIAAALAAEPKLLIADEPTTALDVTTQRGILDLLATLQAQRDMGLILITHDLRLARERADQVVVMRHGQIVEAGPTASVLDNPTQRYTRALRAAVPPLDVRLSRLPTPSAARSEPVVVVADTPPVTAEVVLEVRQVTKTFDRGRVTALADIDLDVRSGECVGVVGESGSGKTTLARCVVGLERPDHGSILFPGAHAHPHRRRRAGRPGPEVIQIVFQDPYSALNPSLTIGDTLAEALRAGNRPTDDVASLLAQVQLPADFARRYPRALSGGERQRVAIARALAPRPRILVCDESVSALDVSVQAQVLNLLADLRRDLGLSMLFITHDLAVVRQVADRISVMRHGRIVEAGPADDVLDHPGDDYTRQLLRAVPRTPWRDHDSFHSRL